ncbi:hypothetical protein EYF80_021766 [Liparis tanakae]|uniref:Uncharacterized protein n=1 Tax=Liparis tanakae TaxID=230148 RepID=A0A4Z2HSJ1_9TELE|nr:hypothetical protein EYF80_021766 [Liparis tanakae]
MDCFTNTGNLAKTIFSTEEKREHASNMLQKASALVQHPGPVGCSPAVLHLCSADPGALAADGRGGGSTVGVGEGGEEWGARRKTVTAAGCCLDRGGTKLRPVVIGRDVAGPFPSEVARCLVT